MKTLDEVIDIFEKACDLERRCEDCTGCLGQEEGCPNDGADAVPDALHYLKEYRSDKMLYEADRKYWEEEYSKAVEDCKKAAAKHLEALKDLKGINDPLSRDELHDDRAAGLERDKA